MAVLSAYETLYDLNIATPTQIVDEEVIVTDISKTKTLGESKRAFVVRKASDFTVSDSNGSPLTEGTDYVLFQSETDKSYATAYSAPIFSEIYFKQPGVYRITKYLCCGSYVQASLMNAVTTNIKTIVEDNLSGLNSAISLIQAKDLSQDNVIDGINLSVVSFTASIASHTAALQNHTDHLNQIDLKDIAQDSSITASNQAILALDGRVTEVEASIDTLQLAVAGVVTDTAAAVNTVNGMSLTVAELGARVTSTESVNATQDAAISVLQSASSEHTSNIASLTNTISVISSDTTGYATAISNLQVTMADHTNQIATAQTDLINQGTSIASAESSILAIDTRLNNIDLHVASTANPHGVTATQVALGSVTNDAQLKRAAADFNTFATADTAPEDIFLFEDASDSFNKKKCTKSQVIGTLPSDVTSLSARVTVIENAQGGSDANGNCPVGTIIPIVSGYFTSSANAGFTSVSITVDDCWQLCNGSAYNNILSPIYNTANRYLPNLSDNRFLMGSTVSGNIGGSNAINLTSANLPLHTHAITHTHASHNHGTSNGANTGVQSANHSHTDSGHNHGYQVNGTYSGNGAPNVGSNYYSTYYVGIGYANISINNASHTHALAGYSDSYTGNSGDGGFANSAIENRPSYLSAKYFIRVY